jgi:hypothetical protein
MALRSSDVITAKKEEITGIGESIIIAIPRKISINAAGITIKFEIQK